MTQNPWFWTPPEHQKHGFHILSFSCCVGIVVYVDSCCGFLKWKFSFGGIFEIINSVGRHFLIPSCDSQNFKKRLGNILRISNIRQTRIQSCLSRGTVDNTCPKPFPSDPSRKMSMFADDAVPLRYYADPANQKTKQSPTSGNSIQENPP